MHSQNNFVISRKKIVAGIVLLIAAVIIYSVLHDLSELYIFETLSGLPFMSAYESFRNETLSFFQGLPFFRIINNYLVDVLWFISFSLIFSAILPLCRFKKILFLALMALLSEFSQFFFSTPGTFDVIDLILYFIIITLFFVFDRSEQNR